MREIINPLEPNREILIERNDEIRPGIKLFITVHFQLGRGQLKGEHREIFDPVES